MSVLEDDIKAGIAMMLREPLESEIARDLWYNSSREYQIIAAHAAKGNSVAIELLPRITKQVKRHEKWYKRALRKESKRSEGKAR